MVCLYEEYDGKWLAVSIVDIVAPAVTAYNYLRITLGVAH